MTDTKKSLLVVDDDRTFVEAVIEFLEEEGFHCRGALDGMEALKELGRRSFDLILSGYAMPGLNGAQLTVQIKKSGISAPVIILTGCPDIGRAIASIKAGAVAFILKPFQLAQLKAAVEKALAGPAEPDQPDGTCREYYRSGSLLAERCYESGRREGTWRVYRPDGRLLGEEHFAGGVRNGLCTWFYESGVAQIIETYTHGQRTTRNIYNTKGELEHEILDNLYKAYSYKDGKKVKELDLAFLIKVNEDLQCKGSPGPRLKIVKKEEEE